MFKRLKKIDTLLYQELPLLLLLLLLILLRVPNFFEPYWYGDEGIYLTLGVAMRQGAKLYAEIIDHKTPLIYFFSLVADQTAFRLLLISWMIGTTVGFYHLSLKLLRSIRASFLATILFVILTSLPWFEGNIPNGELFVMGFAIWGGLLLLYTRFWGSIFSLAADEIPPDSKQFSQPLQKATSKWLTSTRDVWLYGFGGLLLGLGVLTKVPALFDALAFLSIGWFSLIRGLNLKQLQSRKNLLLLRKTVVVGLSILSCMLLPVLISIVYFVLRGSGQAYLDFGLLYNFKYVQNWNLPFQDTTLVWLFSMPGKVSVAATLLLLLTVYTKKLTPPFLFAASWFVLSLFASLLSNRPYPHYYLQVIPSLSLLAGYLFQHTLPKFAFEDRVLHSLFERLFVVGSFSLFIWVLFILNVGLYRTRDYYEHFWSYATGTISRSEYYQKFDYLMTDNYRAAQIINQDNGKHLFIWGTNPTLYALAKKSPTGRFTVSFHIKDFQAYQETMSDVEEKQPMFIVTMNNESTPLPGLNEFLHTHYVPDTSFTHFILWKKQASVLKAYN